MNINFSELDNTFFSISNIFAKRQRASGKTNFIMHDPRPTDGLLLFASTIGICFQDGLSPLFVPQGSLVYLPHNSRYIWENSPTLDNEFQENLLFEFTLDKADILRGEKNEISHTILFDNRLVFGDRVTIITTAHTALYKNMFLSLIEAFNKQPLSPLEVYCIAYDIFHKLSNNCRLEHVNIVNTDIIKKGIKYLENNEKPQKSIKDIANICSVSIGYFERLFHSYASMSPVEYRIMLKINRIKMLLQENKHTLEAIAEKVGYCDSSYLCRIFKDKTGMAPKEYRRLYIAQIRKV